MKTMVAHVFCAALAVSFSVATASAAEGLRNPFWPKGYVGEMTPISAEARPKPKPKPKPQAPKVDPKAAAKAEKEAAAKKAAAKEAAAKEAAAKEAAAKAAAEKAAAEKAAAEKAALEAAAKAEAERNREITREEWKKAMKSLKIGNPAVFTTEDGKTRSTISINGNIYGDGDLMSVTYEGVRFTWRVNGLSGGEKLRLERLRARRIK
jgi:hypothetical protein